MPRRPDILIVDDDPIVITGLRKLLTDVGELGTVRFATRIADARKGIEAAAPDLVLLDVQLPDGNGLDLCREIAADARWADVPVLVLTSGDRIEDEVAALGAGAVDFLTKPVRPPQVVARVRTHLRLKQLADSLRLAACNDVLTGLANRRHIEEHLPRAWSAAMRTGEALSLMLVDVDHFKRYNDHYGHPAGDRCLRAIGAALGEVPKRGTDIVGRYGGEEFLLLLPSTTPSGLAGLAASVMTRIAELALPHAASPVAPCVTLSIGASTCLPRVHGALNWEALVDAADKALYAAKHAGRNQAWYAGLDDLAPTPFAP